jgi:ComF family protein
VLSAVYSLSRILVDVLFPRICCGCNERILAEQRIVCESCERKLRPLREPLCPRCGLENSPAAAGGKCPSCPRGEIFFVSVRAVTPYTGVACHILEKFKYRARAEYADFIAPHMARVCKKQFIGIAFDCIIPVPLHHTRRRERGYNQSALLARHLGRDLSIPVHEHSLRRVRPTPSQTRLSRQERRENVEGAFATRGDVGGKTILLVDDVYTTGATLNECARVLRNSGAEYVYGLCFCRAELD